jgi:hypothetical protein
MLKESELTDLLIFDLETSGDYPSLDDLASDDPRKAELWRTKYAKAKIKDPDKWVGAEPSYIEHTPLSPEFGRIVCASFLHIITDTETGKMIYKGRIKSFYDNVASRSSEKELVLQPVATLLENLTKIGKKYRLCGHNIKKFDIPFLAKRMIMSGIEPPVQLQTWGKKPWEIDSIDTGELWSMGAWDQYVSLDLLTCALDIPSPKGQMKGEYVGASFWIYRKYEEIADYCEEDVKAVARICHKLTNTIIPLEF